MTTPESKPAPHKQILDKVAEELTLLSKSNHVQKSAVDYYVKKEIERRTNALIAGVDKRKALQSELNKLEKTTQKQLKLDGSVASEFYDKATIDQIRTAKERLGKLDRILEAAMKDENPDFNELFKLTSGKEEKPAAESNEA